MQQRFGDCNGSSGWKWENNGVGMGGKTSGLFAVIFSIDKPSRFKLSTAKKQLYPA